MRRGRTRMVKVKICGITNLEDAALAASVGVDAIGLIFAPSPRRIKPERARRIIDDLPRSIKAVGVFVNEALSEVEAIGEFCRLDLIQLHGDESPEMCVRLSLPVIKAFRMKDNSSIDSIRPYCGKATGVLLDTYQKGLMGGTGKSFDWSLAVKSKGFGLPIILSGGLTPQNVSQAVRVVEPFAVDVNSGVEERPGKKDPLLVKRLMEILSDKKPRCRT